jgi:hypothetical protein
MRGHSIAPDVLSAVRHAYQMTAYMESKGQERVTTCVLAYDGAVLLRREVYGMEQACLLRDMLLPYGFVEQVPGTSEAEAGCRMLLKQREPVAPPKGRRQLTTDERWPEAPASSKPRGGTSRRSRAAADGGSVERRTDNNTHKTAN